MGTFDYYAAVVRQVPATDLAKAAARRAVRAAQRALYRRDEVFGPDRVLAAFGAERLAELPHKAFDGRVGLAWCEPAQRGSVRAALERVPGARERALERAERAVRREFDVFGTQVAFGEGGRTDWWVDPVGGHRYPMVAVEQLRLLRPGADPKYPWVIGRLDHLVALGQGAWAAGDAARAARYAEAFATELSDFLAANPAGMGVQWACPMEVALRGANIAQALLMFSQEPAARRPVFVRNVLGALADHARWVEAHLEDQGLVPNNHLVANHLGLLVMALLFPELPDAPRQVALAASGLVAAMEAQVHPDGASFEGSVPYHRLAVELFTLAHVVARGYGLELGPRFADRLRAMFHFSLAYTSERGLAPQVGDNDSGRVFPLRERASLDHGYLLPLGAALFADPRLKREGDELCDEALWLLGMGGVARFDRLRPLARPQSRVSERGGFAILRGGGAVLTASVGANGQRGVGGHSHNDKLSFELHLDGHPVFVDPGSPGYTRDAAQRDAFRATAAHNTAQLDGQEQSPIDPARPFALPDRARARIQSFQPGEDGARLVARHHGYQALPGGIVVERTWVLDGRQRALCVTDVFRGQGEHQVVARLHLPDRSARLRPPSAEELRRAGQVATAPRAFAPLALDVGPAHAPRVVVLVEEGAAPSLADAEYSPGYGQVAPALALLVQRAVAAPGRLGVVVLW